MDDEPQLAGGLYGALIVLEPGAQFHPATDHVFVLGRTGPDEFTGRRLLNGSANPLPSHWRKGERHRLRLINISPNNPAVFTLSEPAGVAQWRPLAKDGADLPQAQAAVKSAQQLVWVGETYDFEYEGKEPGMVRLEVENNAGALVKWKVAQEIHIE